MGWLRRLTARSPQDRFADEVAGVVRALLGVTARPAPEFALRIRADDGTDFTMYLQNLYAEVQGVDPPERAGRIRTAVLAMTPQPRPATWDEAAPKVLPAVRSASWAALGQGKLVRRPLAPFVSVLCAIDAEHAMSFAKEEELQAWGVGEDEALLRAAANLQDLPLEIAVAGPTAAVLGPDGYASSWLAAPAALARVAADLAGPEGAVVAVAADRDNLVLVDTADAGATQHVLHEALERYRSAPRHLSPVPYTIGERGIAVWAPPPGHPAAPAVDDAVRFLAAVEYAQQRATLQELFEKAGADVFVSGCTLMQRDDGPVWTYCVWAGDVTDGLLPQADVVVLSDGAAEPGAGGPADGGPGAPLAVTWDDARRLAGHLLEPAGYDPPLWRYAGRPDPGTVAALREVALPFPPQR